MTKQNPLAEDGDSTSKGIAPLVDTYGTPAPTGAQFGKGARATAEIEQMTTARTQQRPGDYYRGANQK